MKITTVCNFVWKSAFLLSLGLLVSACAVGNQYDYKNQVIEFTGETDQKVGVAVVDQRPYIVSGEKTPNFVGLQRGGFGNPFNVTTKSNEPLADSISFAIVEALKKRNISASVLKTVPTADAAEAMKVLDASGSSRLLMVYLTEWKTDTFMNVKFLYDVKASVADGDRTVLAENSLAGTRKLGGDAGNPPSFARANVPIAFRKLIRDLVNDPKMLEALK